MSEKHNGNKKQNKRSLEVNPSHKKDFEKLKKEVF